MPPPTGRILFCANSSSHTARGNSRGGVIAVTRALPLDSGDRPSFESCSSCVSFSRFLNAASARARTSAVISIGAAGAVCGGDPAGAAGAAAGNETDAATCGAVRGGCPPVGFMFERSPTSFASASVLRSATIREALS